MSNHLINEASPYLKMHAQNPVDWYPWGEEALEKAAIENKPILLSIGYTACHWCHVMASESFEDKETAAIMNSFFINIKVDREERPDLDKVYQLSAQLLMRQPGGWPLTIFLMPKTHIPFFAGTYFPKTRLGQYPSFSEVLNYVALLFEQHQDQLNQQNNSFVSMIQELEDQARLKSANITNLPVKKALQLLEANFDVVNGGFGGAPKFPGTTCLQFLLNYPSVDNQKSKEMLFFTLKKMIQGGIYDQIGSGFFRYAVDEKWEIPHFEKMLYDNSLLLALLAETYAFAKGNNDEEQHFFATAVHKTAKWIINEMQSKSGGFYATLSADTEGEEGKFYVWTKDEIKKILTQEEYEIISLLYGLNQAPNFRHKWHLKIHLAATEIANKIKMQKHEVVNNILSANSKLYKERSKRILPHRDEKIIVSWNGLTIKALALAGFYLNEERYLNAAKKCLDFIIATLWDGTELFSIYNEGKVTQPANLDDYVFLMEGILYFLQSTWSNNYFKLLINMANKLLDKFQDREAGGFYFISDSHEKLIYRLKQYTDESLPASDAIGTKLFTQLGYLIGNSCFLASAEASLKNAYPHIEKYPDAYCTFLSSLAYYIDQTHIIIVRGDEDQLRIWQEASKKYFNPNRLAFFIDESEKTLTPLDQKKPIKNGVAYYCIGSRCLTPIKTLQEFEHELRSNQFRITE